MKKVCFALFCLFILSYEAQAQNEMMLDVTQSQSQTQNDTVLSITQILEGDIPLLDICKNKYDRAIIYPTEGCSSFYWSIYGFPYYENQPLILDKNDSYYHFGGIYVFCGVNYIGCGMNSSFTIRWFDTTVPNETTDESWIHGGELAELQAVGNDSVDMYSYLWNTGETENTIYKPGGTYVVGISDFCATSYRTKVVKESAEIYRATVDLETKLNKVTWQVTPEQAEYISEVKVERDGMVVGTAPYEQGYFLDNIGSENAARNYRLTAIAADGTECPIPSYQKGTLHVDYSPNASNPNKLNMAWTPPFIEEGAPISVSYFQICKYDPETNEVTVVDQLGANNTIGSYDVSLFDGGYAVVAAMFNEGKEYEELAFSNLTDFLVGIEENEDPSTGSGTLTVYPNPAKDRFTIEGTGVITVTNTLGQTVLTQEIDGKTTIELPQGMYFVKLGGATRKIVIE